MRWCWRIPFFLLGALLLTIPANAQLPASARACVADSGGRSLPGIHLFLQSSGAAAGLRGSGTDLGTTGTDGCLALVLRNAQSQAAETLVAESAGFASTSALYPAAGTTARLTLHAAAVQQSVTVTALRGLPGANTESPGVLGLLDVELRNAPGLTLDDRLHQAAGFELFRRTSSWTANPTSQGVSLRGLGSTAASRTLVVSDQVPLNDPFGGWVHWNELPALAITSVGLLRGGAADLYGSSAIGGVIDVVPYAVSEAQRVFRVSADASGATESTAMGDGLLAAATRHGSALAALSVLSTGGYVPTAPAARGAVDVPSNVSSESGRIELRPAADHHWDSLFLRGSVLNEARSNGTPFQTNGTRLWRYQSGADWVRGVSTAAVRLFGSREAYRQSFSSIAADRNSETLTRLQRVPTDELGFVLQGEHAFAHAVTGAAGVDARDIRATDGEGAVRNSAVTSTTGISARQREVGGYLDAEWQPLRWTVAGSLRVDSFRTFDARQTLSGSTVITPLPEINELVASPHFGVTRELGHGLSLSANAFRAFRGPTMNELYRTGQVGQQTTLANNSLLSERATGYAVGGTAEAAHQVSVRAEYFWTEVNRPISAVLLSQMASGAQTLQRENLGQIRSRGLTLEARTTHAHELDLALSYQLAFATVTAFRSNSAAQSNLTGKWIPQVPRESVTAALNYTPRLAALHAFATYTGEQFDDAQNQYVLHPFARFDVAMDRSLTRGLSVFASVQNLLDRAIDAGRTPVLTLAAPRLVQAGFRYSFTR